MQLLMSVMFRGTLDKRYISQKSQNIAHTGYIPSNTEGFQCFNSSVITEGPIERSSAILLCDPLANRDRLRENIGGTGSRPRSHLNMEDKLRSLKSSLRRENDGCPGLVLYFDGGKYRSFQVVLPTIDRVSSMGKA